MSAVVGSAVGRITSAETIAAIDIWLPEQRGRKAEATAGLIDADQGPTDDGRVLHSCPDGYVSILALAECCDGCGWSPSLPLPALAECAERLVFVLGWEDARAWAEELASMLEEAAA